MKKGSSSKVGMVFRILAVVSAFSIGIGVAAGSLIAATLRLRPTAWSLIWIAAVLIIEGVLLHGIFDCAAPPFGRIIRRGPTDVPAIALTFDDGPNEPHTSKILDILKEQGIKATFFVVGRNAEQAGSVVQRMSQEGHEIGNHGYSHQAMVLKSPTAIRQEIRTTSDLLERLVGFRPKFFRAPYGWRSPWLNSGVVAEGCVPVAWTYGVRDHKRPGTVAIIRRTTKKLKNGSILLLHDGHKTEIGWDAGQLVEALPEVIKECKRRGFEFVTLTDMVKKRMKADHCFDPPAADY